MAFEHTTRALSAVAFISSGKRPPRIEKTALLDAAIPIVGGGGVSGYTDQALHSDDALITGRVGTLGKLYRLNGPCWPSDNALVVKANSDLVSQDYLFYALSAVISEAVGMNRGAANPLVTQADLGTLPIRVPSLAEQAAIASVLGALDDRIENLRATNETLEAIVQSLFKSWFVDFDPVKAKAAGKEPVGMDAETAALFPSEFEESELGLIPRGWSVQPFSETVTIYGGSTPKTSEPNYWSGLLPWFSVVDAPEPSDVFVVDTQKHISEEGLKSTSKKLLPTGTTIISARGTVGRVALTGVPVAMNQSCYGLRGKFDAVYFTYFNTKNLVAVLQGLAHGSVFDTITTTTFNSASVVCPPQPLILAYEAQATPLLELVLQNVKEAQALRKLRELLLPKLISGELRLPGFGDD